MDFLKDFMMEMKKVDMKKGAKRVKRHVPDVRYRTSSSKGKDFFIGMAIGGTIGYLAALVFAPQSGEETRAYLSDKGYEFRRKAKDAIEEAVDKTSHLTAEGRDRVEVAVQATRKQIDVTKGQAKLYTTEAREQLSDNLARAAEEVEPGPRI